ncbi:hypothetical protein IC229_34920 [Spirosoma sp. BT702]|uniref:Uncharacterized protein n=1 Tax=Spirosoma profusum TaxID=2771354 RepID=A0A927AWN6_9BACT|nr:hypothetical protein [Spirosoma profusum]MBD2705843.1 hypothetical protein [Spirosoma profusum]
MNATLLEKVEELTLYSIGQDRTNQQQQKQIEKQQHKIERLANLVQQLLEKK